MPLKFEHVVVDSTIGSKGADLFRCGKCNSDLFMVFQIEGQGHPHLQCFVCGISYCEGNCPMSSN